MTEPNANDAGELNLEQLETVSGGALGTLQPISLSQLLGTSYGTLAGGPTPLSVNQGSPGTSAANAVSLTLSGSGILGVGTITMPTTTANPTALVSGGTFGPNGTILPNTGPGIAIDPANMLNLNGTGGFTISNP